MDGLGQRILVRLENVYPGMSQNDLARRVDMDPSALSRVVNGKRGLASAELVALARELRTSTDYLLVGEETFPMEIAARHNYADGSYVVEHDTDVETSIRGIKNVFQQVINSLEPVTVGVPSTAEQARKMLVENCGSEWARHFASAVEETFGVDVVKIPLPGANGLSLRIPNATVIVVPTEGAWSRQNWTIAHELGHVSAGDFAPLADGPASNGEKAANSFAAELLMPESDMRQVNWSQLTDAQVGKFLWESGVSLDALMNRLRSLGLPQPETSGTPWTLMRQAVTKTSPFNDPLVLRKWESAGRRFPARLIAAHEQSGRSQRSLAWMLGAPEVAGADDTGDVPSPAALADAFGLAIG
jgi:Zn-dependent peptidase ImmA (M78 family)/transcriptional regulator with XRE-family HTH domain